MLCDEFIDFIVKTGSCDNAIIIANDPPWLNTSFAINKLNFFLYFGNVLATSVLILLISRNEKDIRVVCKAIQNTSVIKSTFSRQYFSNTDARDKASETINIRKNAIFNFNCLRSKFNKKLDNKIIPNPVYCIGLNFSPTMKYAKIGTDTFPRENNATVIDVSTLRKAI